MNLIQKLILRLSGTYKTYEHQRTAIDNLAFQNSELTKKVAELRRGEQDLCQSNLGLVNDVKDLRRRLSEAYNELNDLQNKFREVVNEKDSQISELANKYEKQSQNYISLHQRYQSVVGRLGAAERKINKLKSSY